MKPPNLNRRLTTLDAAFLYLEKKEAPLHIGSVSVFEGELSRADFTRHIAERLHMVPRFLQKVVPDPFNLGHPTWETAEDFDITQHILERELPAPGGDAEIAQLAGELWSTMLDRDKPLWELHVVKGLAGGRSAMISKVHHCMVDGISGVDLVKIIFDISPTPTPVPPPPKAEPPPPKPDPTRQFMDSLVGSLQEGLNRWTELQTGLMHLTQAFANPQTLGVLPHLGGVLPAVAAPPNMLPFNGPCSGQRTFAWCEFSFQEARAIRGALNGTVNDVVLTALSGAVSRYAQARGQETKGRNVRFMVPVSLRQAEQRGALGNLISILPVEIPLDISNPVKRFRHVNQKTGLMKMARLAEGLGMFGALYGMLPAPLQAVIGQLATTPVPPYNMVATNVPGPQVPLYVLGHKMTAQYPHVPIGYALGLGCAIFSYDQRLYFGLTADKQAMPDVEQFKKLLDESFAELRERAGLAPPPEPAREAPKKAKPRGKKAAQALANGKEKG
jgi:WS/DGAT/MGAT family acyltransferase